MTTDDVATDEPSKATEEPSEASEETRTERLTALQAKATAEYAVKHYREAAELYSQATELQAEINGEMAVENADLLYAYGKCLFFLAQQTSSVLGGEAAAAQLKASKELKEAKEPKKSAKKRKLNGAAQTQTETEAETDTQTNGKSTVATENSTTEDAPKEENGVAESTSASDKPYFRIEGDAAGWGSDDDDDDDDDEDEEDGDDDDDDEKEEQDDFSDAYEMLDIARVLYLRKLAQLEEVDAGDQTEDTKGKGKAADKGPAEWQEIKSRVADIHDLQAEVLLEGEKYADAVEDLEKCLALKQELLPPESSLLAECHFKLSLALEFASQSQPRDALGNPVGDLAIDWAVRERAIAQQEAAIASCRLRVEHETGRLAELKAAGGAEDETTGRAAKEAEIADVEDMIAEMQVHLADLRKPPINVKEETATLHGGDGGGSVLGSLLGASEAEQAAVLARVAAGASDISGLVKKKQKGKNANENESKNKRKADDDDETSEKSSGKKVKIQEA